jgi:hypothetical protein
MNIESDSNQLSVKYGPQLEKDHRQLFVIATNGYIFTDLSILLLEKPNGLSFPESTVNG